MFKPTGNVTESLPEKISISAFNEHFTYQNSCLTDKKQLLEERFLFSRPLYICSTNEEGHRFHCDEAKTGPTRKANKVAAQPAQAKVCSKLRKGMAGSSEEDNVLLSGDTIRPSHLTVDYDGCNHTILENDTAVPEDCTSILLLNTQSRHQTLTRLNENDMVAIGNDTVFRVASIETYKYAEDSIDWADDKPAEERTKVRFGGVTEIHPQTKKGKKDKGGDPKDEKDAGGEEKKGASSVHHIEYPRIFDVAHSKRTHRMITTKEAFHDSEMPVSFDKDDLDPQKHSGMEPTKQGSADAACDSYQRHSVKDHDTCPQVTVIRASSLTLKVVKGPSKGTEVTFKETEANGNIGTDATCHMVLEGGSSGVTGVHCRVVHKNGSFYIEDKSAAWHFDTLITKVTVDKKGKVVDENGRSQHVQRIKPYTFQGFETRVLLCTPTKVIVGDRVALGSTIFELADVAEGYGLYSKMYDTDHLALQMTARRVYRAETLKSNGFDPAFLSLESGEAEGVAFGRSTKCSVSIRDIFMSEFHFAINFDENEFQYNLECNSALKGKGIFVLLGRGDTEGTNFQHTSYPPVELSEGDVILIGGTELKVVHINHGITNVSALIEHQNKKFSDDVADTPADKKETTKGPADAAALEEGGSEASSTSSDDSDVSDTDSDTSDTDSETDSGSSAEEKPVAAAEPEVAPAAGSGSSKKKKRKKRVKPLFVKDINGVDMEKVEGTFSCLELEATSGPRRRQKWAIIMSETLPNQTATLGKGDTADVPFDMDQLLDPQHTMIEYHNGGFWVRDLQSKWGTYARVGKGYAFGLNPGDIFIAGSTEFLIAGKLQIRAVRTAAPCCSIA